MDELLMEGVVPSRPRGEWIIPIDNPMDIVLIMQHPTIPGVPTYRALCARRVANPVSEYWVVPDDQMPRLYVLASRYYGNGGTACWRASRR